MEQDGVRVDYNDAIQALRDKEYPMIKDSVYLDHAGSAICPKSLMDAFSTEMTTVLYGNPHSASWPSQLSTSRIEDIRLRLLSFFNADPAEYDLVFVPNATAGVKLVVEGLRSLPGRYNYAHHQSCHTSLVGVREEAVQSACLSDEAVTSWLEGEDPFSSSNLETSTTLFAYSAQSHMNGKRYPLSWSKELKDKPRKGSARIVTLLDAASLSASSPLDLNHPDFAADFTVLSLYKIFGFPDLGALIVRRSAEDLFNHRKYFGGGTVDMVVCGKEQWHAPKSTFLHERLEDGTLPFHSIMAVDIAMRVHRQLFGSMEQVSLHTSFLTRQLLEGLRNLRHGNGQSVCTIYTEQGDTILGTGPVVSFNLRNGNGAWISLAEFDKLAIPQKMHVRTGGLCSPGSISSALGLEPWEVRRNFSAGFRCGTENDIMAGKPTGVIRASLGAMSTVSDVCRFVDFIKEYFTDELTVEPSVRTTAETSVSAPCSLRVKAITVYPIKSCGGIAIPKGSRWEIRPEGLAWDREWCLVHRGSGQALSQKRHPKMALLQPSLDFEAGVLVVEYRGQTLMTRNKVIIPLSENPALFDKSHRQRPSRVCGEEVSAETYVSEEINDFFTDALGVPCVLARFPAGGRGLSSRLSKARVQRYQQIGRVSTLPGSFPDIPSPPDSDSEQQQGNILLSNESPILMIFSASVSALNRAIKDRGGVAVQEAAFRANIVIESSGDTPGHAAYSEDSWSGVRIGTQHFKLLGACRRCQMVCIDQETGEKKQEPFSTLAKTRRFDGKVYFGTHMRHELGGEPTQENQYPTIQIGEIVEVKDD